MKKVKTEWTREEMNLLARQIDKYHQVAQGTDAEKVFRDEYCLVCDAVRYNCRECPLSNAWGKRYSCVKHKTFVCESGRRDMSAPQAKARRDALIKKIHKSGCGVEIYFE